jgi:PIN domain nuclease of toxin-antitoxin system
VRLLLDTHALLWWFAGNLALPAPARTAIDDAGNDVLVSAASAWEIATKHRLGKLPDAAPLAADLRRFIADQGFLELAVTVAHGQLAGALTIAHKDPFDRMLVAQALLEDLVLVSNERRFDASGVRRLW